VTKMGHIRSSRGGRSPSTIVSPGTGPFSMNTVPVVFGPPLGAAGDKKQTGTLVSNVCGSADWRRCGGPNSTPAAASARHPARVSPVKQEGEQCRPAAPSMPFGPARSPRVGGGFSVQKQTGLKACGAIRTLLNPILVFSFWIRAEPSI